MALETLSFFEFPRFGVESIASSDSNLYYMTALLWGPLSVSSSLFSVSSAVSRVDSYTLGPREALMR
jgi:hypothetical protein